MLDRFEVSEDAMKALVAYMADKPEAAGKGVRVFFSGYG